MSSKHLKEFLTKTEEEIIVKEENEQNEELSKKLSTQSMMKQPKIKKKKSIESIEDLLKKDINNLTEEEMLEYERMKKNFEKKKKEQNLKRNKNKRRGKKKGSNQQAQKSKKGNKKNKKKQDDFDFLEKITKGEKSKNKKDKKGEKNEVLLENVKQKPKILKSYLNPNYEYSKVFGEDAIKNKKQNEENCKKRHREVSKMYFVSSKIEWPQYFNPGFYMKKIKNENGINYYSFVYSSNYLNLQKNFDFRVNTNDPQNVFDMYHRNSWHVDTLLAVAEIYSMQNQEDLSNDCSERALYIFERSMKKGFLKDVFEGKGRIIFDYKQSKDEKNENEKGVFYPNHSFFMAMWKRIHSISSQGMYKTAYEIGKLLFSIYPEDPCNILMILDFFALKGNIPIQFLEFCEDNLKDIFLPNILYSSALCEFYKWKKEKDEKLKDIFRKSSLDKLSLAIKYFPTLLSEILDAVECSASKWNKILKGTTVLNTTQVSHEIIQLYKIYTMKSATCWKNVKKDELEIWVEDGIDHFKKTVDQKEKIDLNEKNMKLIKKYSKVRETELQGKTPPSFFLERQEQETFNVTNNDNAAPQNLLLHFLGSLFTNYE